MQIEIIEPASIELDDAIEFYELQLKGLGKIFFEEVLETTELISQFPDLFTRNSKHTRKALLRKFPFSIHYFILLFFSSPILKKVFNKK